MGNDEFLSVGRGHKGCEQVTESRRVRIVRCGEYLVLLISEVSGTDQQAGRLCHRRRHLGVNQRRVRGTDRRRVFLQNFVDVHLWAYRLITIQEPKRFNISFAPLTIGRETVLGLTNSH